MEDVKLTDLEKIVLKAAGKNRNYSNVESEIRDNACWFNVHDIVVETELAKNVVKGVIGSLVNKGMLDTGETGGFKPEPIQVPSDKGMRIIYEMDAQAAELDALLADYFTKEVKS